MYIKAARPHSLIHSTRGLQNANMAAKFIIFAFIVAAVGAEIADECLCDPPSELETKGLWQFFKQLSTEVSDTEDKNVLAVLPGELSPLLDCNCVEKNRKKRKILPEVTDEAPETPEPLDTPVADPGFESVPIGERSPKCPQGYVWFGILCVDENLVLERK